MKPEFTPSRPLRQSDHAPAHCALFWGANAPKWLAAVVVGLGLLAGPQRAQAQRPLGTDVSGYQPSINWTTVKNAGVAFAWTKATEGTDYINPDFTSQEAGAKGVGIYVGAYHYARPSSNPNITGAKSADSEAAYFWNTASNYVKGGGIYCVPMLDWEDTGATVAAGFTVSQMSAWVNEWCSAVSNYARLNGVPGIKPVVYTGVWYSEPSSTYPGLNSSVTIWPDWIAAYPYCNGAGTICGTPYPLTDPVPTGSGCYPWTSCSIWQYGNTNWSGGDSDVYNGNLSGFVQTFVMSGTPPAITSQPASQGVLLGASATFSVGVSGATPFSYQWRFNGGSISGATGSSFTTNNVQTASAGSYSVVVTNSYGSTNSANAVLTVHVPPVITNQPASQTVLAGSNVTFSVGASGTTPLAYQWRFNGANISGATATSFTTNNVPLSAAGNYSVVVTNGYGTTNSGLAVLTVHAPAVITAQPVNVTTGVGLSATLSVTATGNAPLSYQWRFNGGSLTGATTSSLAITSAQATNAGTYVVVVTNLYGAAISSNALLVVLDPYITNQPQSQIVAAGAMATLSVGAGGTAPLRYAWSANGVALADGGNISGSGTASLTVGSMQASNVGTYSVTVSNGNGGWVVSSNATLYAAFAPVIVGQPASQQVLAGSTALLSVAVVGSGPISYQWQRAGTNLVDGGKLSGSGTASLTVSNVQSSEMASYGVVVTNTNGVVNSSNALVSVWPLVGWGAGAQNTGVNPNYGQGAVPANLSNVVGIAAGNYHNLAVNGDGTVVGWGAGQTNSGVSPQYGQAMVPGGLSNVVVVAAGYYHSLALQGNGTVVGWGAGVTNAGTTPNWGQALAPAGLSNVVAIAGGIYHSLALQGNGTVVAWGAGTNNAGVTPNWGQALVPAGLSNVVAIAGGAYHSLALQGNGTVVAWGAGTNNAGVTPNWGQALVPAGLSNVVAIAGGAYHSLALQGNGTVVAWGAGTNNTGVTPNWGQALVPAGLSNVVAIAAGSYHSLALKADGTVVIWGAGTNNTGSSPNYGQAVVPVGLSNVIALAGGGFHTLVLAGNGSPSLTTQPVSQAAPVGAAVNYAVLAVGSQPLSYQWQLNGTNLAGATAAELSLAGVQPTDAGSYTVVVSNAVGVVASSNALLVVLTPPVISGQPSDQTVIAGVPVLFSVAAAGSAPLGYQWQFGGMAIAGATQSSYSLGSADPTNAGTYAVVVTNAWGEAVSSNAVLTVLTAPAITTQPSNQTVVAGADASFIVLATSAAPVSYQWYFGGTNVVAGGDGALLSLAGVQPGQAGGYSVVVTNVAGSVTSVVATLTVLVPVEVLVAPALTAEGVFQCGVGGAAGSNYVIEASTDLTNWVALATNTSPFTFTDTNAVNVPMRFYRAQPSP